MTKTTNVNQARLPANISRRWWCDVLRSPQTGEQVEIVDFPGVTEVNAAGNPFVCIAKFAASKHAREFCQLNGLRVIE